MTTYEYIIFQPESTEDIAATFSTSAPLPHIQVGHSLLLESDMYSTQLGHHLVISDVETYLHISGGTVERIRASVFVRVRDRAEILQQ